MPHSYGLQQPPMVTGASLWSWGSTKTFHSTHQWYWNSPIQSTLNLTTLAERRLRGDLIKTFRVVSGHVNYGHNVFNVSKCGNKLIAKSLKEGDTTIKKF